MNGPRDRGRSRPGAAATALALVATVLLTGCGSEPSAPVGAQPVAAPEIVPLPIPTFEPEEVAATTTYAAYSRTAGDVLLPDPSVTPGVAFPDVTAVDVCELHYTQGVRQPRFNDKVTAFGNYGISIRNRDSYQVDHLIPIALGGTNATENLWPQPRAGERGAAAKDELEHRLRALVCAGTVPLAEAQAAVAGDWSAAYDRFMVLPAPVTAVEDPGAEPAPGAPDPFFVTNGGPCPTEGVVGRTESKGIKFSCQRGDDGQLRWGKRY